MLRTQGTDEVVAAVEVPVQVAEKVLKSDVRVVKQWFVQDENGIFWYLMCYIWVGIGQVIYTRGFQKRSKQCAAFMRNLALISDTNDGGCRCHGLVACEACRLADFVRRLVIATRVVRVSHGVGNVVEVTRLDYE